MAASPKKLLALDTNLLLDLAAGKDFAHEFKDEFSSLVTSDKHLLDVDEDALLLAFNDADLLPVHPSHPKRLLKALR